MNYQELSNLKRAVENDLKILAAYEGLVKYDQSNPIPNAIDSESVLMAKRYFPTYIKALRGTEEIIARHIAAFEQTHKEKQAKEKAEREKNVKLEQEKTARKKQAEEDKKTGANSLFQTDELDEEEGAAEC